MHVSPTRWLYYLRQYFRQRQVLLLVRFFGVCVLFVAAYSVLFHVFMAREGHTYSWVTGLYWTLTVMSTLGFGDITFTSDVGRVFTLVVLLSGVVFLLVLLPLVFVSRGLAPTRPGSAGHDGRAGPSRHVPKGAS